MSPEPRRLRLRAAPGRPVRRALVLALAAAISFAGAVWPPEPTALWATEADSGTGDAESDIEPSTDAGGAADPQLFVAPADAALSADSAELRVDVLIRNPGEDALAGGTAELTLTADPIGRRGEQANAAETEAVRVPIAELDVADTGGAAEQRITATVAVADLPLSAAQSPPGVYELRLEFTAAAADDTGVLDGATLVATAPVVWRGSELAGEIAFTAVVPFLLPPEITTMPTPGELATAAPRLDRLLTAAESARATLAVDPRIIAAIRGYGEVAPPAARALLERLEASPSPSFLLQFADADPAAQAALGFEQLLAPSGLGFLTRDGVFENVVGGIGSGSASDVGGLSLYEGEPQAAAAPSLEKLVSWTPGYAGAWPASGQADRATLELLGRSGVTRVLLDSRNATAFGGARLALPGGIEALVADTGLSSAARLALTAPDEIERAAARAELAAILALAADQGSGLVLALDRGIVADLAASEEPAQLLDWLVSLDWVAATPESQQSEGSGSLIAGETSPERLELLGDLIERSARVTALAPLLQQPEYLREYQSVRLLAAFATRYATDDLGFRAAALEHREHDELLLRGVEVVPTANIQLVGTSSQLPVQLHNSLPFDASVSVRVAPVSAGVAVPERRFAPERVAAGGNSTVLVPVHSRISSGESALQVQIADRRDEQVFLTTTLPLTLRTRYETILLTGLAVSAALLFGFGVWRSVRRRRSPAGSETVGDSATRAARATE